MTVLYFLYFLYFLAIARAEADADQAVDVADAQQTRTAAVQSEQVALVTAGIHGDDFPEALAPPDVSDRELIDAVLTDDYTVADPTVPDLPVQITAWWPPGPGERLVGDWLDDKLLRDKDPTAGPPLGWSYDFNGAISHDALAELARQQLWIASRYETHHNMDILEWSGPTTSGYPVASPSIPQPGRADPFVSWSQQPSGIAGLSYLRTYGEALMQAVYDSFISNSAKCFARMIGTTAYFFLPDGPIVFPRHSSSRRTARRLMETLAPIDGVIELVVYNPKQYLREVGEAWTGYAWDAPVGALTGLYQAASHPIQTVEGVYVAVTHPLKTGKALYEHGKEVVLYGDVREQGKLANEFVMILVPSPWGADKLRQAAQKANTMRKAIINPKAPRLVVVNRTTGKVRDLGEANKHVGKLVDEADLRQAQEKARRYSNEHVDPDSLVAKPGHRVRSRAEQLARDLKLDRLGGTPAGGLLLKMDVPPVWAHRVPWWTQLPYAWHSEKRSEHPSLLNVAREAACSLKTETTIR